MRKCVFGILPPENRNGRLSVIASPLAILVADEAGFVWVMLIVILVNGLATGISVKLVKVPGDC